MCLKAILSLLNIKQPDLSPVQPDGTGQPMMVLPYPEEPPDFTRTVNNVDTYITLCEWFETYRVPVEYWDYWRNAIDIQVYDQYPDYMMTWTGMTQDVPALTWEADGKRHMAIKPAYLNCGVVAHEEGGHGAYDLLSGDKRLEFETVYGFAVETDPLMVLLDKQNDYMNTSAVEAHAEVYRYLGPQMPEQLKDFYPRLF